MLHDMDPVTWFCKRCGAALEQIEAGLPCAEGENVTGISHRIAARRLPEIVGSILVGLAFFVLSIIGVFHMDPATPAPSVGQTDTNRNLRVAATVSPTIVCDEHKDSPFSEAVLGYVVDQVSGTDISSKRHVLDDLMAWAEMQDTCVRSVYEGWIEIQVELLNDEEATSDKWARASKLAAQPGFPKP